MNIVSELKELSLPEEGTRRMNRHGHSKKNAVLSRVLARAERQNHALGHAGHIGNVIVGRKQKTVISPRRGKILDEHCCVSENTNRCLALVELTSGVNLPNGLQSANVLTSAIKGRVPVSLLNSSVKTVELQPEEVIPQVKVTFGEAENKLPFLRKDVVGDC